MDNRELFATLDNNGWRRLPTNTLGKLLAIPGIGEEAREAIMDELDDRKYDDQPEDTPSLEDCGITLGSYES